MAGDLNKIDCSGGLPQGFESFSVIKEPRTGGNKKHHFGEVLCGMNGLADIEEFCHEDLEWFEKWIKIPNGIPRAQTFSNIFALINPAQFNQSLIEHLSTLYPTLAAQIIAVDGKALRGSHELGKGMDYAVSAWAADTGVTLAQVFVTKNPTNRAERERQERKRRAPKECDRRRASNYRGPKTPRSTRSQRPHRDHGQDRNSSPYRATNC